MRNPDARITVAVLGKPVDVVTVPEGGTSAELRLDWFNDPPGDVEVLEWRTDGECEFVGDYAHIKAVKASTACTIWVRAYDANGFYFDTPKVMVVTYPVD